MSTSHKFKKTSDSNKFKVKFKTNVNLVWGKKLKSDKKKREAIAYQKGFPATFYLTSRRAFVTGAFVEKRGLFGKASNQTIYFEAGLQHLDKFELEVYKHAEAGYLSFKPHGDLEKGIIHFIKMDPMMIKPIQKVLENATNIKKPIEDTGKVIFGENPLTILKKRTKK